MLIKLNNNIWYADQKQSYHGIEVGTRMTVIKLIDGSVILISPISITPLLADSIRDVGVVSHIIAPNIYHHLYLEAAARYYPAAMILVAPGLEEKYSDINAQVLSKSLAIPFDNSIEYTELLGYAVQELSDPVVLNEIVFFHKPSRTLIITDGAYHIEESSPFWSRLLAKISGLYYILSPTSLEKRASKNKKILRESVTKILEWPFDAVIMAHGEVISTEGKAKFQKGFEWLLILRP